MVHKIKVGIIGAGKGGSSIYKTLKAIEDVEIKVVCDLSLNAPGILLARQDRVITCSSIQDLCKVPLDIIIEATGVQEVHQQIENYRSSSTSIMDAKGANLMIMMIEEKEKQSEIKHLKEHLDAMLSSIQQLLQNYNCPDNVKELKSVIEKTKLSVDDEIVNNKDFLGLLEIANTKEIDNEEPIALDEMEKRMIRLALKRYGSSVEGKKQAAQALNISLATLYNKIKTL